ncbi:MAG: carboxypeptidase M32 [Bacteroidia bacterium]|nr:carboxypeptidase M32 [Bacteroidia bacterium]
MTAFEPLQNSLAELADLRAGISMLTWDKEVNMAAGSAPRRARQIGTLAGLYHKRSLEEVPGLLEAAEKEASQLDSISQADLREIRRDLDKQLKFPLEFVKKTAQVTSEAQSAWLKAREENSFLPFAAKLTELVDLKRQSAEYAGYQANPYDALLDLYHPGMTTEAVTRLFEGFKRELGGLVRSAANFPQIDTSFVRQVVPEDKQIAFSKMVLSRLGFDFQRGRQDSSAHPFTIPLAPEDVRITTLVSENDPLRMLFFSIHEGGHGIYEQSLRPDRYGLPSGQHCSISIHESQSRLYENNVGRSQAFWEYFFPHFADLFPDKLAGIGPEDIFRVVNRVVPSPTRINSDELSYHTHIILRFELENEMISGKLQVKDLEKAWEAKMQDYLGIRPASANEGVLQDIHWAHGNFGYFPTYSLGSFYAAQFMQNAQKVLPDLENEFAIGNFTSLKLWLNENIHRHGRVFLSEELCKNITGEALDVKYFVEMMKNKYHHIYQYS